MADEQKFLDPDMAPVQIDEIDEAAKNYVNTRNKWQELGKTMGEKKTVLFEKMHEHKLEEYRFGNQIVVITPGSEELKVNTVKEKKPKEAA